MRPIMLVVLLILFNCYSFGQDGDFISIRKRNGRLVKTYVAGSPILLQIKEGGMVDGKIEVIRNDSVIVRTYDVRKFITPLGVSSVDTLGSSLVHLHHKDIERINAYSKNRFLRSKADKLLIIGGAGYLFLNVVNGALLEQPVGSKENLTSLGIASGALLGGLAIRQFFKVNNFTTRRDRVLYVRVK